jgi:hypothetical protein
MILLLLIPNLKERRSIQMKGIIENCRYYFKFFLIILLFTVLSGCNGVTPTSPIINSFTADSTIIDEGDSVTLSWTVTDATTVTINQGIGSIALSGSTSVSPISTTTYTLTATNSAGSSLATVTITVNPAIVEQTLTIQPGPAAGKDAYISSLTPDFNYASNEYLSIGQSIFSTLGFNRVKFILESYFLRAYLQFDLSELPDNAVVVSAVLKLYQPNSIDTTGLMIDVHQVTESWEENTISWNNKPDYLTSPESTITVPISIFGWLSWDITSLVQGWANGSIANYGVLLKVAGMVLEYIHINCYSSNYAGGSTLHPKLEITYHLS